MSTTTIASAPPHVAAERLRILLLRFNAVFLLIASIGGFGMDVAAVWFGKGPAAHLLGPSPMAGVGFIEAHGLAFIIGVLLWRALSERQWHVVGAAVGVLLGTCNVVFWQAFIAADALWLAYATTVMHWFFALSQSVAASTARR